MAGERGIDVMRLLALAKEAVLRERLAEVVFPRSQIRIGVRLDVLIDVRFGGEVRWVATDILRV